MILFIAFIILIVGGFIGLLYFNTIEYGHDGTDYKENNLMYNIKTDRETINKVVKEKED